MLGLFHKDDGPTVGENFGKKDYLLSMTNFHLRSNTTNVKMNRKSDPSYAAKLWKCYGCHSLDTQSHIMWCPAFAPLREGLDVNNDKDIVHYFQQVFRLRDDLDSKELDD